MVEAKQAARAATDSAANATAAAEEAAAIVAKARKEQAKRRMLKAGRTSVMTAHLQKRAEEIEAERQAEAARHRWKKGGRAALMTASLQARAEELERDRAKFAAEAADEAAQAFVDLRITHRNFRLVCLNLETQQFVVDQFIQRSPTDDILLIGGEGIGDFSLQPKLFTHRPIELAAEYRAASYPGNNFPGIRRRK